MKIMYITGSFIFCLLSAENTEQIKGPKNYAYIARVQTPPAVKSNQIKAYYKGTLLSFDDSWCLIPEDQKCLTFSIIITPAEIQPVCEGNTTRYLKRNANTACSWYDLTLNLDPQSKGGYTWTIEKKNSTDMPLRLPERSILLYTNPEYIEAIQHNETEKPVSFSTETLVINFPTIIFSKKINSADYEETAVTALLASLDLDTIHARVKTESKKDQHLVISMLSKQ